MGEPRETPAAPRENPFLHSAFLTFQDVPSAQGPRATSPSELASQMDSSLTVSAAPPALRPPPVPGSRRPRLSGLFSSLRPSPPHPCLKPGGCPTATMSQRLPQGGAGESLPNSQERPLHLPSGVMPLDLRLSLNDRPGNFSGKPKTESKCSGFPDKTVCVI